MEAQQQNCRMNGREKENKCDEAEHIFFCCSRRGEKKNYQTLLPDTLLNNKDVIIAILHLGKEVERLMEPIQFEHITRV